MVVALPSKFSPTDSELGQPKSGDAILLHYFCSSGRAAAYAHFQEDPVGSRCLDDVGDWFFRGGLCRPLAPILYRSVVSHLCVAGRRRDSFVVPLFLAYHRILRYECFPSALCHGEHRGITLPDGCDAHLR